MIVMTWNSNVCTRTQDTNLYKCGKPDCVPDILFGVIYCALRLGVEVLPRGLSRSRYPGPPLYSPKGEFLVGYKVRVLVGLY
jgi:hypothetical protein